MSTANDAASVHPGGGAPVSSLRVLCGVAGLLYLAIIVLGVWSEGFVRGSLITDGDPAATAAAVRAHEGLFRASFAADVVMAVCDVALAVALFVLLRPAGFVLALAATAFRLVQATLIGASLLGMQLALLVLRPAAWPDDLAQALAATALEVHGLGYDLGLVFFGVNSVLTGVLLWRSDLFPRWLGVAVGATGLVYLLGSGAVLLAPAWSEAVQPLYLMPLLAETAFCVTLLVRGLRGAP